MIVGRLWRYKPFCCAIRVVQDARAEKSFVHGILIEYGPRSFRSLYNL
jgi:hypothetical protein